MRFSTLYTFVSAALLAAAGPIRVPRQTPPVDPGLAFLTILEFGATGFYQELVQTFNGTDFQNSGFADGQAVSDVINVIAASEASHFAVLQGLSGGGPPPNCTLDFSPALVNPMTALATARTLEYAAIASYVGVIASEPSGNNSEVFSEIMGNEARHEGFLGMLLQADPFPQSFEIGMTPSEVLTQLLPFNPSCNPALTLTPNPPLTITNNGSFTNTTTLTFDLGSTPCANQTNTFCQLLTGDDTLSAAIPSQNCTLAGLDGGVLVYVTSDSTQISADPLQRGNISNLCAGPAVIFVDPVTSPPLDALLLQPASTSSNSTA